MAVHSMPDPTFPELLARTARAVEAELAANLEDLARGNDRLHAALRHGVLAGGKRLRPFLLISTAALFGLSPGRAMRTAAALECVHSYSLIHDDLPAMDDDDLRRGKPTVHRAYDEATAILAGDALLTLAFEIIADPRTHADAALRCALSGLLARAAGANGMIAGQMLDMAAESTPPDLDGIITLQQLKTGALIGFAIEAGARLGGASEKEIAALNVFGRELGLAFQITDDLLDATGSSAELGKAAGKDQRRGKATFVSLMGVDGARDEAARCIRNALEALAGFGEAADPLRHAARFVLTRSS
jgi:farnesyl diphosphate synthase